ncbi:kinetochore Sim4 complex subunit Fta4 [Apiosordaria backusii]|uniref:Kinetochore Sim4 complex subunit Fta4 n=1 Tax=Apiosordaria backusii TaxID=314023 RepID=A0AA40K435_9PEZI|nr:kinetochore Sim4 complex subunit Fta4 [Apiosordaria backusii]
MSSAPQPPPPPTITTLKSAFLTTQTRVLTNPLHRPTRVWESSNDELPEKQVNDALAKLNHRIQQHGKRVYAPQATRHVAEQIDALYTTAIHAPLDLPDRDHDDDDPEGEGGVSTAADLADKGVIERLPDQWPDEKGADEESKRRYEELVGRLKGLEQQRVEAQGRVARLRGLKKLLEPFEEAGEGVQRNLVGRNGEVEQELERMRMLLARVGGRVTGLRKRQEEEEEGGDGMDVDGVEGVLGRF